jgi:protease IV
MTDPHIKSSDSQYGSGSNYSGGTSKYSNPSGGSGTGQHPPGAVPPPPPPGAAPPVPPGRMPPPPPPAPGPGGMPPGGNYRLSRPKTGMWRTLGLMLFIGVIGFNVILFFLMFMGPAMMGGGHDPRGVHEYGRTIGTGPGKIAVIPVEGVILERGGGGLFGGGINPVALIDDGLRRAARDERVKAVIIEVNSPGGGVTASDLIYERINRFREETGKPVVVYMKDLAASGGYYVAAPSDYIIANRTTLTGSIGVVIQGFNFHGTLTEIIKGRDTTITAGDNKVMGGAFVDPESEDFEHGRALLQELVDDMHELFLGVVEAGRGDRLNEGWREYADGRIFNAQTALRMGFIDDIGYFEDAVRKAEELSGTSNATVVEYGRQVGLAALFGMSAEDMEMAGKLGPGIIGEQLSAKLQEQLRLYPGRPMAIWIP